MAAITPGQPCGGCSRPLVPRRNDTPAAGWGEHRGHGLCSRCYERAHGHRGQPYPPYEVDEIAVERAILGDPPEWLHYTECRIVVDILTRRGLSAAVIAQRIRVTERTVTRHRAKLRQSVAA